MGQHDRNSGIGEQHLSAEHLLARHARLRYVSDDQPGFRRLRRGRGFVYVRSAGQRLRSQRHLQRIESLAIPPGWEEVWICAWPNGHLQSTGRDARKRKQYIYHARWCEIAQYQKFEHLARFGSVLPKIRRRVARDLRKPDWTHSKLAALAVRLLDRCALRIGSREYVRDNASYGLTTLESRHLTVRSSRATFEFAGKSGKPQRVELVDSRLSRLLAELKEQQTPTLLSISDGSETTSLTAATVNEYLQEITDQHVTAKDFRTWKASVLVSSALARGDSPEKRRKRALTEAVKSAAQAIGNTPAVCRKHYVLPSLIAPEPDPRIEAVLRDFQPVRRAYLSSDEQRLLAILDRVQRPPEWTAAD